MCAEVAVLAPDHDDLPRDAEGVTHVTSQARSGARTARGGNGRHGCGGGALYTLPLMEHTAGQRRSTDMGGMELQPAASTWLPIS